jgi:hypothetical protein
MLDPTLLEWASAIDTDDAEEFIRVLARQADLSVLVLTRADVEAHVGRSLSPEQWDWFSESALWEEGPFVDVGPFIDRAFRSSEARRPRF